VSEHTWKTAITKIEPNFVRVRGYDIAELMGRVSFGSAVHLILQGKLPSEPVGKLMDAIVVSSIDHGATPPSVLAARTVASTGASLSQSVAAGILSINASHGGAIQDCATALGDVLRKAKDDSALDDAAAQVLDGLKASGKRMSGFGHRVHTADPRTARLFELAQQAGLSESGMTHMAAARAVERVFVTQGKALPINVDGAIGAILADLGFAPEVMNGIFMVARVPGLVAHVSEEQAREKRMRKIDPVNHAYDGPKDRSI
jgi:citryl-CoA lyase